MTRQIDVSLINPSGATNNSVLVVQDGNVAITPLTTVSVGSSSNVKLGANNQLVIQTAANTTGFVSAPSSNNLTLIYDGNSIAWGEAITATTSYTANSISLDPSYGTYNSGNVLSIRTVGDYNLDANNYYSINETSTTPGYIAYIDFLTVERFNRIAINLFYTQNSSHVIYVDLYNKDTLAWDSFGTYNGLGSYYQFALAVLDDTPYIDNGRVQLRLYHASAGNTGHNHRIDYVALEFATQGPQGPKGTTGATGATGAAGNGIAIGGTAGQILFKANSTNYATEWGDLVGGTGVTYDNTTKTISIGQNVASGASVEFKDLLITGNLEVTGNVTTINSRSVSITDNMIYLNEAVGEYIANVIGDGSNVTYYFTNNVIADLGMYMRVTGVTPSSYNTPYVPIIALTSNSATIASANTGSYVSGGNAYIKAAVNPDLGWSGGYNDGTYHHAGMFRDATDGTFKVFDNYGPEPDSNVYIDTSHATFRLANLAAGQFIGPVIGNVSDLSNHTTANLTEQTNLYYTNARVYANVSQIGYLTGSSLSGYATNSQLATYATNSQLATYATNAQLATYATNAQLASYATNAQLSGYATTSNLALKANIVDLTTANITELTNLYFSNVRVKTAISSQRLDNAHFTGTLVSGEITVSGAGGDEGGQINLEKAVTNTSLSGNITIDVYQNRLRIFESGGSARGVYVDLTSASGGVGTNLIGGGSGTISSVAGVSSGAVSNSQLAAATVHSQTLTNATFSANVTADRFISLNNGNGENYKVGDDAWIGDTNLADTVRIKGQQNAANSYIALGNNDGTLLGRSGSGPLTYNGEFSVTGNVSTGNVSGSAADFTLSRLGTVQSGTWNGSSISTTYTEAKITLVANQTGSISNSQLAAAISQTGILNTSNISEGSNLYFTNARSVGAFTAGSGIVIDANGLITSTATGSGFTGNIDVATGISLTLTGNLKANVFLDGSNRRLLIRDANSTIVWGG